jgi:hypothetical protein
MARTQTRWVIEASKDADPLVHAGVVFERTLPLLAREMGVKLADEPLLRRARAACLRLAADLLKLDIARPTEGGVARVATVLGVVGADRPRLDAALLPYIEVQSGAPRCRPPPAHPR